LAVGSGGNQQLPPTVAKRDKSLIHQFILTGPNQTKPNQTKPNEMVWFGLVWFGPVKMNWCGASLFFRSGWQKKNRFAPDSF